MQQLEAGPMGEAPSHLPREHPRGLVMMAWFTLVNLRPSRPSESKGRRCQRPEGKEQEGIGLF